MRDSHESCDERVRQSCSSSSVRRACLSEPNRLSRRRQLHFLSRMRRNNPGETPNTPSTELLAHSTALPSWLHWSLRPVSPGLQDPGSPSQTCLCRSRNNWQTGEQVYFMSYEWSIHSSKAAWRLGNKRTVFQAEVSLISFKIKSGVPQGSSLGPLLVSTSAQHLWMMWSLLSLIYHPN